MSTQQSESDGVTPSPERLGSAKLRGRVSALTFIAGVERSQRIKCQRDMFALCNENRALGGTYWKTVLKRFGLTESEVWPNTVIVKNDNQPDHT